MNKMKYFIEVLLLFLKEFLYVGLIKIGVEIKIVIRNFFFCFIRGKKNVLYFLRYLIINFWFFINNFLINLFIIYVLILFWVYVSYIVYNVVNGIGIKV